MGLFHFNTKEHRSSHAPRTKNMAHRGFSGCFPENTMPAFTAAAAVRLCDGIENDVQLSRDGEVVICHDEKINRTCTSGQKGWVRDYTVNELQHMDFSYRHPELTGECPMPTLREYLAFVRDKDIISNIELKTSVIRYDGIEQKVYDLIREYNVADKVIISSFNHYSVLKMKEICPEIACGLLSSSWILNAGEYVRKAGCEYYHPEFHNVTPEIAREILDQGIGINAWTVNREEDIRQMMKLGISGVIGNYPDLAASCL